MGFFRMRDETFFVCRILDWLKNFAGYKIQSGQTPFGMRDWTKSNCDMQEMTSYIPFGDPLSGTTSNMVS